MYVKEFAQNNQGKQAMPINYGYNGTLLKISAMHGGRVGLSPLPSFQENCGVVCLIECRIFVKRQPGLTCASGTSVGKNEGYQQGRVRGAGEEVILN